MVIGKLRARHGIVDTTHCMFCSNSTRNGTSMKLPLCARNEMNTGGTSDGGLVPSHVILNVQAWLVSVTFVSVRIVVPIVHFGDPLGSGAPGTMTSAVSQLEPIASM